METGRVIEGDSKDVLQELPENSVHAIVTDPPYGLNFMPDVTNGWDDFEPREYQEWCEVWAKRARRVLRPGGHLLAFSGNRTHHRLFSGVEDAGYEVRDTITWHYGSGFPKALDVSKAIDKQEDAEREVVGTREQRANSPDSDVGLNNSSGEVEEITAPATDAAERWQGWKTHLKPASEFVVVARNPLGEDTVAGNVREWGTGALNIGDCRIGSEERENAPTAENGGVYGDTTAGVNEGGTVEGRYPANVVFDQPTARELDREVGDVASGSGEITRNEDVDSGNPDIHDGYDRPNKTMFADDEPDGIRSYGDGGGPSRYFYTSKASRSERTMNGQIKNDHPTVKPVDLMEWLVRLVTREGQTVLDPFAGSGTTLRAAKNLCREFVGIERKPEYADLARVRAGLPAEGPSNVRADDGQRGLYQF